VPGKQKKKIESPGGTTEVFGRNESLKAHVEPRSSNPRHVECGGSTPLFAAPASRGVLPAFGKRREPIGGSTQINANEIRR
jgi:hypothetical protein